MTKVTLLTDEEDTPRGFLVEDHSGFAERGADIVCAAVSILTINTINAIDRFTGDQPQVEADKEKTRIRCVFDTAPGEGSRLLLNAFSLGVRSISEEYGEHMQVKVRRYR